jgi:hypothetical protein
MRQYKSRWPILGWTKVIMPIPRSHKVLFALLPAMLIVLAQPGSARAQQMVALVSPAISEVQPSDMISLPEAPSDVLADPSVALVSSSAAAFITPVAPVSVSKTQKRPENNPFWDRQNRILFTAVGGMATADFFVTRANLASGGKELNPVTRIMCGSTPALAANFALETGGVIGLSYLFHKTGHHTLERMTSYVNISASGFALAYSATHR